MKLQVRTFGICGDAEMKKYAMPVVMLAVFETVAVVLWLTKGNLFYLFNFSYIGISVSLGVFLFIKKYKHARRIVQLLVGLRDSGTISSQVYLRRQRSIMPWQRYSGR